MFAESGQLGVAPVSYKLAGTSLAMIHDIAVTEDYYVAVVGPVNFNPGKVCATYYLENMIAKVLVCCSVGVMCGGILQQ